MSFGDDTLHPDVPLEQRIERLTLALAECQRGHENWQKAAEQARKQLDAFSKTVRKWVIEYDENSVAEAVDVEHPDIRRPLAHGQIIETTLE